MHWLDAILLALLVLGAVLGARSGLLRQLARILGFGFALYATVFFHEPATDFLLAQVMKDGDPRLVSAVAYVAVFCILYLTIYFGTLLIERGLYAMKLEVLNRILGAVLGASQSALLLGAAALALANYPHEPTQDLLRQSALAPWLATGVERGLVAMPGEYREELQEGLEDLKKSIRAQAEAAKAAKALQK